MKILITILGFLNGGFMLADGIHVMLKGKYIGSGKPGPWTILFTKLDINVFKLGPVFIFYGILWMIWLYALWANLHFAYIFGVMVSVFTLWYLPVGTIFFFVILIVLITAKTKIGL